ncbi:MAG: hypothetical protein J0H44_06455 [Alphaproteobacteria bacterium]|nr:hypothetical protein [Alphaproteobacteria bacterium]
MWAGAAIAESGGNLCASNGYNFGVLQLSAENVGRLGLTPEEYMDLSLQDQIDNWALVGATDNNASRGYKAIDAKISMILRLGHVIDGVLAACSQFGETICNNDIEKFIEAGKPLPVPNSADAIPCKENTCGHGTANQDGNGHTIVSWGLEIQKKIHMSRCQD